MIAALALALAASGSAQDAQRAAALIDEARFDEALREADGLEPPERERLTRRALHHAGDLPGALAAGRAGLALAPRDLELLLGTADVALTIGDAPLGSELVARLGQEARALPESDPNRAWWLERATVLARSAAELASSARARARALARARTTTLVCGGLALVGLALLARRG